ncbi:hypothetical protein [Borrelia persica]|uniref:hypothetical protein n=1 Tax=Borrelia persica TaxID=44448 RepID=UPI000466568E|nr:hypothetical protein [Borrelia persica]
MILKNKYLALILIFNLIGCDLFLTEETKSKSSKLLNKVNSMIMNTSDKDIKNNFNNKSSQTHLPKIKRKSRKIRSLKQKDIKDSLSEHENITIRTADTSQNKSYSNSNIINNNSNTVSNTNKNITTTSTLDNPTIQFSKENPPYQQNSETIEHQSNLLQGNSKTSLNELNGESNNIKYDYTYRSHYDSKPIIISGSYSDSSMTIEEDEFEEDEDEEERLETRLDNIYKFKLKKTIDSVQQALEIAEQIKDDWNKVEFYKIKLNPMYGRKAEEYEKQKAREELSKFTKDKLEANIKRLLNEIEKSLNAATILITNNEYGGSFQSDLSAKTKLDELKNEVNLLIIKINENNNKDHQVYPTLYSKDYQIYHSLQNPYSKLQLVKNLLHKTGIVTR